MKFPRIRLTLLGLALCLPALAQTPKPLFHSTEIAPGGSTTFRFVDPAATTVTLQLEGQPTPLAMQKQPDGVWTVTSPPLAPEIYTYHFIADTLPRLDPANVHVTTNLVGLNNLLTVPGPTPQLWDKTPVPHGTLHRHTYTTSVVLGLPANQCDYIVYTPPGYDAKAKKPYPVLYLLHGWGDQASGWTSVGHAEFIFDNLLAQGKIKPMLVVMPLAYGDMSFIDTYDVWQHPVPIDHNTTLFAQALLTEVLPQVESTYNVSRKREDRAIAGFSMGGLDSVYTGLNHTDLFAWIGGFSSAVHALNFNRQLVPLDPKTANLRLLWIACGTEDSLIKANRKLVAFLKEKNLPVTPIETPGAHVWQVWRENLGNFAPLLFQTK